MTVRVLVVDDQALVRRGFGMILGSEPDIEVVGEASDGRAALDAAAALAPDVVLMDVRMPEMDGIEATARLSATPGVDGPKVLILTTFDLDDYVYAALPVPAASSSRTPRPRSWCTPCAPSPTATRSSRPR
ncbi:MAG: response regulator transcription factor [Acidimicrobiales bacterium]